VKFQHLLRTDQHLDFAIRGNTFEFSFHMIGEPSRQKTIQEDIALAQTLDTFRYAGGENWFPSEIHLTTKSVKRIEKLLSPGNYKLYCNQPVNKIVFPLEIAFKDLTKDLNDQNIEFDPDNNLSSQITRLLKNTTPGTQLSHNQIVEISNMSSRTLSRRLAEEGVTFNQLASNVMFEKATNLLSSTNSSVKEISQYLGYSESQSFVRAFKKTTKLTPELYRAQC
jgi:AraC-like DNA-binding protein